ncbi:MAG: S8 family serine peptidase [Kineosporiaceae bacterium]
MTSWTTARPRTRLVVGTVVGTVVGVTLGAALAAPATGQPVPRQPPPGPAAQAADRAAEQNAAATRWGDDTTGEGAGAIDAAGLYRAQSDLGSMYTVNSQIGAHELWLTADPRRPGRTLTGVGVGVAVIDTGVAPVPGLDARGKVVNGPDLSFESQATNTRWLDGYGHGTHMAGIVAGRTGAPVVGGSVDPEVFAGVAPDATVINVKVGAGDGGVDVSQVVAAVDWVVEHREDLGIRVLNLSYGTTSTQSSRLDPLAHAVENAWRAGIVVVTAAGNGGEAGATTLTMPAVDPYVLAVGSSDYQGARGASGHVVGAWTNDGTSARRPDLVAPGKSLVSLRVPGGFADVAHPEGRVPGVGASQLFRGTGTSQSAAVVSGAVALLLQRFPELTPDQVKWVLTQTADRLSNRESATDATQGAGLLDVDGAVDYVAARGAPRHPSVRQTWPQSTGLGSLEASRGGTHTADPDTGEVLLGEQDIFGVPWDARSWAAASSRGTAWSGGYWRGVRWTGSAWTIDDWQRRSWSATDWTRRSWSGVDWSRRSWSASDFSRRSWSAGDWQRRSWSADSWGHPG